MWNSFGEYILSLCDKNPTRIAEIGVGKFSGVYDFLNSKENVEREYKLILQGKSLC